MTAPHITVEPPVFTAKETPDDFGPDATQTPKRPPRATESVRRGGKDKKPATPGTARQLTGKDADRIAAVYATLGKFADPFHARLAGALVTNADDCAAAWVQLANSNVGVRRMILRLTEGGDWGNVVWAHLPLFMAAIPENTLEKLLMRGMGMFTAPDGNGDETQ